MARRRVHNISAIVKAYQAEAKRATRCGHYEEAEALLRYAILAAAQPAEGETVEASVKPSRVKRVPIVAVDEWSHLPTDQAEWARELARRDAVDLARREGVR
jgi:hypothetical protein